ncbi:MAG: hypothetical protein FWG00_03495 [Coriobacteriia bacterium]|nr:hypothetical protein [Coriobacteriia bacterium]
MIGKIRAIASSSKQVPSATTSPKTSLSKRMLAILVALVLACSGFAGVSSVAFADDTASIDTASAKSNPLKGAAEAYAKNSGKLTDKQKVVAGNMAAKMKAPFALETRSKIHTAAIFSSGVWKVEVLPNNTAVILGYTGKKSTASVPQKVKGPDGNSYPVSGVYLGELYDEYNKLIGTKDKIIKTLNLSKCTKLQDAFIWLPKLKKLTMGKTKKPALKSFTCYKTQVSTLDVSKCSNLEWLDLEKNALTKLNVSKNKKLKVLECGSNNLTSLKLSNNKKLLALYCNNNYLTALKLNKNTKLIELVCSFNQLKSLSLSKNKKLESLSCSFNQLKSLNLSKNKNLDGVNCSFNNITKLNVSKSKQLFMLSCGWNKISSLKLNKNIVVLSCSDNKLKSLNVTKAKWLWILDCSDNKLKKLNVSKNKELEALFCYNNNFTAKALKSLKKWRDNNTYRCTVYM